MEEPQLRSLRKLQWSSLRPPCKSCCLTMCLTHCGRRWSDCSRPHWWGRRVGWVETYPTQLLQAAKEDRQERKETQMKTAMSVARSVKPVAGVRQELGSGLEISFFTGCAKSDQAQASHIGPQR